MKTGIGNLVSASTKNESISIRITHVPFNSLTLFLSKEPYGSVLMETSVCSARSCKTESEVRGRTHSDDIPVIRPILPTHTRPCVCPLSAQTPACVLQTDARSLRRDTRRYTGRGEAGTDPRMHHHKQGCRSEHP